MPTGTMTTTGAGSASFPSPAGARAAPSPSRSGCFAWPLFPAEGEQAGGGADVEHAAGDGRRRPDLLGEVIPRQHFEMVAGTQHRYHAVAGCEHQVAAGDDG